ncbi:MAG: hypothetical protein IT379_01205 [Deltaproteobacteria bacterium]|nr:hypothetical protein [Deltaproteobacteria bacterium]
MARIRLPFAFVPLLLPALLVGVAAVRGQQRTISVDEIRPGMRGHGMTVFRGTVPERFDVEVIDVLHQFAADQDLILIRSDHPIMDHASTVAGMSGSPIYLDGRLAGAYAYGWTFGKDPVAGVTPIGDMMAQIDRPERPRPVVGPGVVPRTRGGGGARPTASAERLEWLRTRGFRREPFRPLADHFRRAGLPTATEGLAPAATPLMIGGGSSRIVRFLEEQLAPYGIWPMQAGGGGPRARRRARPTGTAAQSRYVDGGAIAVELIRGDITATGIGTVTHVAGRRLVAFGHPMMGAGQVELPTAQARVLHILASEMRSFKLAEATDPLGTLVQDRLACIVVDQERRAPLVPVRVRLQGVAGATRTEWNMEVASHRLLTPMLVFSAVAQALEATASDAEDVVVDARSAVHVAGRARPFEFTDTISAAGGLTDMRLLFGIRGLEAAEAAVDNPFEESRLERVDVTLNVRFAREEMELLGASTPSSEVDPGDEIPLTIVMRRFGHAEETRTVRVAVPPSLAGQDVDIEIAPGNRVVRELPIPRSLDELIGNLQQDYPATTAVVTMRAPSRGVVLRGHVVRDLPRSMLDTLVEVNDSDRAQPVTGARRFEFPIGRTMFGTARLRVRVREVPTGS